MTSHKFLHVSIKTANFTYPHFSFLSFKVHCDLQKKAKKKFDYEKMSCKQCVQIRTIQNLRRRAATLFEIRIRDEQNQS